MAKYGKMPAICKIMHYYYSLCIFFFYQYCYETDLYFAQHVFPCSKINMQMRQLTSPVHNRYYCVNFSFRKIPTRNKHVTSIVRVAIYFIMLLRIIIIIYIMYRFQSSVVWFFLVRVRFIFINSITYRSPGGSECEVRGYFCPPRVSNRVHVLKRLHNCSSRLIIFYVGSIRKRP